MATVEQLINLAMTVELANLVANGQTVALTYEDIIHIIDTGGEGIIIYTEITLEADLTIDIPLIVLPGGKIDTAGFNLTLNGSFSAPIEHVFIASDNEVEFGPNATQYVLLEWFGALGDGVTNDTAAVQKAFNASITSGTVTARVPVTPLGNKIYMITSVNVPARCTVYSPMGRTSGPTFRGLSSATMFVCPTAYSENQITFDGITIDGVNVSACTFDVAGATGLVLRNCCFTYTTVAIKMTGNSGGINYIHRCRFAGDVPTCIQIGANVLLVDIDECMFSATSSNAAVYTDSTWTGDSLRIRNCNIDAGAANYGFRFTRLGNGTPTLHVIVDSCRFDGGVGVANLYIGQYVYANVINSSFSGGGSNPSILCDGDEAYIGNNYFGNNGVTFGANARACIAGPQKWGGFSPHYIDSGLRTIIDPFDFGVRRIGTTAERPTLMATGMFGTLYMDTTLDADGKPIWWNGAAWVDATGAVV